jgi:hypothetical protein
MDLTSLRKWWPVAGVALLLALASVVVPHSSLQINRVEPPVEDVPGLPEYPPEGLRPSFPPQPGDVSADREAGLPEWITTLAAALCVLAVLAVVGLLLFTLIRDIQRRRSRAMPAEEVGRPPARAAADVVAALDAGLVDLSDTDADPRRAVIACWVRLEQAAAAAGTARQIGDSPTDLVTRLLLGHEISGDLLAALAHVYREARYATHTVDERMRIEARSALQRLRAELTADAAT